MKLLRRLPAAELAAALEGLAEAPDLPPVELVGLAELPLASPGVARRQVSLETVRQPDRGKVLAQATMKAPTSRRGKGVGIGPGIIGGNGSTQLQPSAMPIRPRLL